VYDAREIPLPSDRQVLTMTGTLETPLGTLDDADRRVILDSLGDCDAAVGVGELARRVTAARSEQSPADVSDADCRDAVIRLHHNCLPKLDAAGLVEFRPEAGTVDRRAEQVGAPAE
jgi:hypothetical protein